MGRAGLGLLALLASVGAGACSDFRYYDIDLKFTGFSGATTTSQIQIVHVYVTGADTRDFYICDPNTTCPFKSSSPSDWGTFEYSSLSDSGTLNFDAKVFNGTPEGDSCQVGEGMLSVSIDATVTNMETLTVAAGGLGCHP